MGCVAKQAATSMLVRLSDPMGIRYMFNCVFYFFFQAEDGIRDLTVTGVQTCALPIYVILVVVQLVRLFPYDYLYFNELVGGIQGANGKYEMDYWAKSLKEAVTWLKEDRKSTRLNSSHSQISYAVFCLKKKKQH